MLVALGVLFAAGCNDESEPARHALFTASFETGDLSEWQSAQQAAPDRIRIVKSPVDDGKRAARFEVKPGDFVAHGGRAEVLARGGPDYPDGQEGDERWYGWSTLFPKDGYPPHDEFQIFVQWKTAKEGPPPVAMGVVRDKLNLHLSSDDSHFRNLYEAPLERGRWHRFVVHLKFSSDARVGFVELWHDDRRVLQKTNAATLRRDDKTGKSLPNYLKMGLYRYPKIPFPQVVYHDGMRIGTRYGDVAPR